MSLLKLAHHIHHTGRMKFAILGATGGTGLCLVRQALDKGHEVTAIVRNTAKLSDIQHEKFKAVEGDVFSAESIQPHLEGCDAVFSCLGTNASMFSATTIYSAPMKSIVTAMRGAQVKRITVMSSWWVKIDPNDDPGVMVRWFLRPMMSKLMRDVTAMESFLVDECQDLDFTVIRPGVLTDGQSKGKEFVVDVNRQFCNTSNKIPRADVARFMLQNVETEAYYKQDVAIGLKN